MKGDRGRGRREKREGRGGDGGEELRGRVKRKEEKKKHLHFMKYKIQRAF